MILARAHLGFTQLLEGGHRGLLKCRKGLQQHDGKRCNHLGTEDSICKVYGFEVPKALG